MADETSKLVPIRELLLIIGMGGGGVGTAVYQGQANQELIKSNRDLTETVRDSFSVKEVLEKQRDLEIKLILAEDKLEKWERRTRFIEDMIAKKGKRDE